MGKGRKPVILSKGQAKISSFFVKKNQPQNQQKQTVLSDKSNTDLPHEVQDSPYFKDAVKSPATHSSPEVILDEVLASPKKGKGYSDENCDVNCTTPKQTLSAKRKLCTGEESPDFIPPTPTTDNRRIYHSRRHTTFSKMGIVKLEKHFSDKESNQTSSLIASLDNSYNSDALKDSIHSVNNAPEFQQHTSLCKKTKLQGIESSYTHEGKYSGNAGIKVVRQVCGEQSTNRKSTIKNDVNENVIDLKNTQGCTKLDDLSEKHKSHDDSVDLAQVSTCGNLSSPKQYVNGIVSSDCVAENIPVEFVRNSEASISNDAVHTCNSLEINKTEPKQCINVIGGTVRSTVCLNEVKTSGYTCGFSDSSTEVLGYDHGNTEKSAVSNKETHLEKSTFKSNPSNLEAEGSDCSVQKSDQCVDVLSDEVQLAALTSAEQQAKTESCADSLSGITQEDRALWLSFDDWDLSLMEDKETESRVMKNKEELSLETFQRCEILELESQRKKWEKVVKLRSTHSEATTSCLLQGFWADSCLKIGDIVSIIASRCESSESAASWLISNSVGLLVHHPDTLISSTAVVGSLFCPRRGVLSEWFRGIDGDSTIMVIGSLVHELLQEVLERKLSTLSAIRDVVQELLSRSDCVKMLYSARISKDDALKELEGFAPRIANFVDMYVQVSGPKLTPLLNEMNKNVNNVEKWNGTICAIRDIEENIWAPKLGIKGKVDVTVEVKINRHKKISTTKVLPLELKTGRSSFSAEHKGQVTLYTMMMSLLGNKVDSGLLLYLRDGVMQEVKAGKNEWRDLIILRNQLAHFITKLPAVTNDGTGFNPPQLPEPINHHTACEKCPYLTVCTSFLKHDGLSSLSTNNPLAKLVSPTTSHLSPSHIDYLIHWTGLLLLEESQTSGPIHQKDLWCMNPVQREKRGKNLCSMVVTGAVKESGDSYVHVLKKDCEQFSDLRTSGLAIGEYVTVSTDDRLALSTGTICDITQSTVTLLLNRNMTKYGSSSRFHIDVYTLQSGKVFNLTNIGCLMDDTDVAAKLRKLIIDKERPTFVERLRSSVMRPGRQILEPLNMSQRRAVVKALTANDYFLIKGMPGTGKTATIVSLVELLVKLGQSVLVTSHTHSAVDNVLLKLADRGVDLLRLGSSSRIHPQLRAKSEGELTASCTSPAQLEALYNSKPVVGTTCLGAGHPLFTRRNFDVCIVDESTQVLQVSVLRPLFSAKKFILIGDPEQLPPVIRSKTAREMGMSKSLFARLDSPDATVCLDLQYRMNQAITDIANGLTYNGQLKCGNEQVSNATLQLPAIHVVAEELKSESWLCPILSTAMNHSALVLDTGPTWDKLRVRTSPSAKDLNHNPLNGSKENNYDPTCRESSKIIKERSNEEKACTNIYEATLIQRIVTVLLKGGVEGSNIGVIAPYRAQVALLQKMVAGDINGGVEVNTVDQYQGRDKEVIIFSCTRTENVDSVSSKSLPTNNKESEILGDKRRLTVAITRAKHKLLIIGDVKTLQSYQPFQRLFDCLTSGQIIVLSDGSNNFEWNQLMTGI